MTKIALVLSGGGSTGAYTAGATAEVLTALDRNEAPDRVTVEVITGSGSGAFSAALAARALVVNPNLIPWIERAWVEALDARHLMAPDRGDRRGLLDLSPVEELLRHLVAGEPASDDRTSPAAAGTVRVGLSLTRLPGRFRRLRFGSSMKGERTYAAPLHAEERTLDLPSDLEADADAWRELWHAAAAGFAFPLVFPARRLAPGAPAGGEEPEAEEGPPVVGEGLGTERPLSLAHRLWARSTSEGDEDRRYVVVEPRLRDHPEALPEDPGPPGSLAEAAEVTARSLRGAGTLRDWLDANDAGARADLLGSLVRRLPEIHDRFDDPDAVGLGRYIGELAERVAEREVERNPEAHEAAVGDPVLFCLDEHLQRIQSDPAYGPAFEEISSRAGRTRLGKLVYVLEAVGDLQETPPRSLHLVAPREAEPLAGDALAGLGGFLSRDWRRHDFRAGRRDARRLLEGPLADAVSYRPDEPAAYEPGQVERGVGTLGRRQRRRLTSYLEEEADRFLASLSPSGLSGVLYRLVRPGLRKALARRLLRELEQA